MAWIALAGALAISCTGIAYYRSFAGMKPFDDEGGLIESVRSFVTGHALYDQIPSIYGPVFYFYEWLGHTVMGVLPTNDSIRILSVASWVAATLLSLWFTRAVTASWMISLGVALVTFRLASFVGLEPGHPQEVCLVLTIGAAAVAVARWSVLVRLALLGGIAFALAATKINAGIFMAAVVAVSLGFARDRTSRWKLIRAAAGITVLLMPVLLMRPNLEMAWVQRYLFLELCSLAAVLVTLDAAEFEIAISARAFSVAAAGVAGMAMLILLFVIARGSTLPAMASWVVVKPRQAIGPHWFLAFEIPWMRLLFPMAGLGLAVVARARPGAGWIPAAKLALGVGVLGLAAAHRGAALVTMGAPFLWLAALPVSEGDIRRVGVWPRAVLSLLGVLMVLYAYPVAGAQVDFAAVTVLVVSAVVMGDAFRYYAPRVRAAAGSGRRWAAAGLAVAGVALAIQAGSLVQARRHYRSLAPLNVGGVTRLRFDATYAKSLREMIAFARASCSQLITAPGMPSFNLWAGLTAAPLVPAGNWITGLDDASQERVVDEVAKEPQTCVVYNREMVTFWTHGADVEGRPMMRYIHDHFRRVLDANGNELLIRSDANAVR